MLLYFIYDWIPQSQITPIYMEFMEFMDFMELWTFFWAFRIIWGILEFV